MKLNKFFCLILVLTLFITGCRKKTNQSQILSKDAPKIVQDNTAFAVDIYKQLCSSEGNLFISPYSISTCLAMTYAGARGETEKQMAQALHFTLDQNDLHPGFAALQAGLNKIQKKGKVQLNVANSLWPQEGYLFLEKYLSLAKNYYDASVTPVNLSNAAGIINKWVEDKTEGKITNIITDKLYPDSSLTLVSAMYFKGFWKDPFFPGITRNEIFNITVEKAILTPMMRNKIKAMYTENDQLQILDLPYIKENISMLLLLPKEIDGLEKIESNLSVKNLDTWRKQLKKKIVIIYLPKFKMTSTFDLIPTFKNMGMIDAFRLGAADFSGMADKEDLFISNIIHKAFVDVDEEVYKEYVPHPDTWVSIAANNQPIEFYEFRADHPFLFLIQDKQTGSILFIGRLKDPTKTGGSV